MYVVYDFCMPTFEPFLDLLGDLEYSELPFQIRTYISYMRLHYQEWLEAL